MRWLRVSYWVLGIFILVSVAFNFRMWVDLFGGELPGSVSDGSITEFITETAYQQIKSGKNPFERTYTALYPFGVNFSLNDPGIGVLPYYSLFRQFVGVHQAMILVLFTNLGLTGWLMWKWLRHLNISEIGSGIAALVFSFTPFISHRLLGHYTYVTMFVFPLFALVYSQVLGEKVRHRTIWAIGLGGVLAWSLYLNFYYFIMLGLSLLVVAMWKWKWAHLAHYLVAGLTCMALLIPWLMGSYTYLRFEDRSQMEGFGGAIYYSAQLQNFVLPSAYNPVYQALFGRLGGQLEQTFLKNWERMVYPGLLILLLLIYWAVKRKMLPGKIRKPIDAWILGGLAFTLLTMGPFLKWRGSIELLNLEGVAVVLPLPFLILHYLPGLDSLRVPGRFTPAMVFMFVTGGAYLFDFLLQKTKHARTLILIAVCIFVLDQAYQIPESKAPPLPTTMYEHIAKDAEKSTVLEIPFTVRDGFRYAGFVHAIGPMQGTLIHHKSIVGGYLARVSDEVMDYYQGLKLIGYLLKVTDRGNYHPVYEEPSPAKIYPYPYTTRETNEELDFLGVKYILVKEREPYTEIVTAVLSTSGAVEQMRADGYLLYRREVGDNSGEIVLGNEDDYLSVGQGFAPELGDSRKMIGAKARLFIRGYGDEKTLTLTASSPHRQIIDVYMNEHIMGIMTTSATKSVFIFDVSNITQSGINTLFLHLRTPANEQQLGGVDIYRVSLEGQHAQ